MKPRFIPDLHDWLDSFSSSATDEFGANFLPSARSDGADPVANTPPEITSIPALASQDLAPTAGPHHLDDSVATPLQEDNVTSQISEADAAAPEDSGGAAAANTILTAVTTVPAPTILASPMATGFIGAHVADVGGAIEVPAHDQIFYSALSSVAPASATMVTAGLAVDTLTSTFATAATASVANPAPGSQARVTDSSVGPHGATAAQVQQALDESGLSVDGTGIKVGVISDSFDDLGGAAADEADGVLPAASNIDLIKDLPSGGTDEGRAMMQVIHDIAPGASLAFYTADESEQDFANGILALAAAGCKVICDDVSYFDEPFFQNGVVAQAIQTVEAEGVTYVTAAGNNASNGYQAAWTSGSGSFDGWSFSDAELFGGSLTQTITVTASSADPVPLLLEWNEAYGQASFASGQAPDIDLFVFHNGVLIGQATNATVGEPNNPWTGYEFTASGTYQIVIANNLGPDPGLIKEILAGDGLPATISGANTGTVVGHAMTPGAITAGAVSAADTPAFSFSPTSESFSSSGAGAELLFANNGTALSSPDLLNPVAVSSVDDIATTIAGNLSDFYGTSAASASLAGVAALILAANPNLTPSQVEQIMEETALPMSNSAVSGAGLVQVDAAVALAQSLPGIVVTANISEPFQGGAQIALLADAPVINDFETSTLASASVKLVNFGGNAVAGDELYVNGVQNGSVGNGVSASWNASTDTLTLTGSATIAVYETLLGEVSYQDAGINTSSGGHPVRTVTWSFNDGSSTYSTTSPMTIDRLPVATNDVAFDAVGSILTTSAANGVLSNDTDLDSDRLYVIGVSDTANGAGSVGASFAGVYGHLTLNVDGSYTYIADNLSALNAAPTGSHPVDTFTYMDGDGNGGHAVATLSVTIDRPPVVTGLNQTAMHGEVFAGSSLLTASDADGDPIATYAFWDSGGVGYFVLNGVAQPAHTEIDVSAAQLSQLSYVTGFGPDLLSVRASDGTAWSSWTTLNVTAPTDTAPVVTGLNQTATHGEVFAGSSLLAASDPDGDPITTYAFWDSGGVGHFVLNGVVQPAHTEIDVSAAQLSELSYVTGFGPDLLSVRASDGDMWSAWTTLNINAPPETAPVVTGLNQTATHGEVFAGSSLLTASDADGDPIATYAFWDSGGVGHFVLNGVVQPAHTEIDVSAAQLSQLSYVTGFGPDLLSVRASDGDMWSAWTTLNINAPAETTPVVTGINQSATPGQVIAGSSLLTASDADGDPIATYAFWDSGGVGHFVLNGVVQPAHTEIDVSATQLSQISYVAGTGPDLLSLRVSDGNMWSAWTTLNVTVPAGQSPAPSGQSAVSTATAPIETVPTTDIAASGSDSATLWGTGNNDTFAFKPGFGHETIANFAPGTDAIEIDHSMFATVQALLAATHNDTGGNAVIAVDPNDTITLKNVTTAELAQHQGHFFFV